MHAESVLSMALIATLLVACQPAPTQGCEPAFPYQQGWLGGDAAYSVPLSDGRSLWLFGDTFVSADPTATTTRAGSKMIHNTLAVSTCDATTGEWKINYTWPGQGTASPAATFDSGRADLYYWPMDGFVHGADVLVALDRVVPTAEGGAFGFRVDGVALGRLVGAASAENPGDAKGEIVDLVPNGLIAGVSIVPQADGIYLFTQVDAGTKPIILLRLPTAALDGPLGGLSAALQYLAQDGTWKNGANAADAKVVIESGATEMSVRFHEDTEKWVAVYPNSSGFSNQVLTRTAPALAGPWTTASIAYRYPEMTPGNPAFIPGAFCYAPKEHVEFLMPEGSLITYACNTTSFVDLINDMRLYRPVPVPLHL